jgi:transcriptional regulator with XRE-family HTH domain
LANLKGVLATELARQKKASGRTRQSVAAAAGIAPAVLSRALNPFEHSNTKTLFRIAFALDKEWVFGLEEAKHLLVNKGNGADAFTEKLDAASLGNNFKIDVLGDGSRQVQTSNYNLLIKVTRK